MAEPLGQLDPQPVAVQSVGVLIGSLSLIAGKLPLAFGSRFMPAYTTISIEFAKPARDGLVSDFHSAFIGDGVAFDRVFPWGCKPDLSYDEIVEWNQNKLDTNYRLGYDQHVSNDFRQILLVVSPFSTCRMFVMNTDAATEFHCIIPEDEIGSANCEPLLRACVRAWSRLPVLAIESYGEIDAKVGHAAIKLGTLPSASLFAIVDYHCQEEQYSREFNIRQLDRGKLLTPKNAR